MKLQESTIATNFSKKFYEEELNYPVDAVPATIGAVLMSMATFLSSVKDKEKAMALVVDNLKGDIEFGMIVKFIPGETEDDGGSWSLVCSFDQNDFVADENVMKVIKFSSGVADNTLRFVAMRQKPYAIGFNSEIVMKKSVLESILCIKEWLSDNASETEDVYLELDGIFVAKVSIEDGVKYLSMELSEEATQVIKNDAGDQK